MQKFVQILVSLVVVIGGCVLGPPSAAVATSNCNDVEFIFARGSGEPLGGPSMTSWETALRSQLAGSSLRYDFYELGSKSYRGAQYPAVAVSGSVDGIGNLLGAFISSGESFAFARSVAIGRSELKSHLQAITKVCPQTKFVLGGYSQGAMLLSGILDDLPAEKIIYVATFGDPKLYLPEGKGNRPVACRGQNLSNYRAYVTDCHAYEGVLGSYRPYQPAAYYDKVGTWCNNQDIMCSSGFDLGDHTKYTQLGLYNNAASRILGKLQAAYPQKFSSISATTRPQYSPHDLVIFWHAGIGGSGKADVATYKLVAQRLINQTYSLGGRVALYVYSESLHGQKMQLCDFNCTADEVNQKLSSITSLLTTGTHYNCPFSLMRTAFKELDWQVGATKSVVVLTQDRLDYTDHIPVTLAEIAELSLSIDPVNIYPIMDVRAVDSGQRLAEATNGKAYAITDANLAIQEITARPVAGLALEAYVGQVGEEFTFDASRTNDGQSLATAERYEWDLDADGRFELETKSAVVQHRYTQPVEGYIQVRVIDSNGRSSTMSARLSVTDAMPALPSITGLRAEQLDTTYQVGFHTDASEVLVLLNDAPLGVMSTRSFNILFVEDVEYQTTLRLIPYLTGAGRGAAAEITFGPDRPYQFNLSEPAPGNEQKLPATELAQEVSTDIPLQPTVLIPTAPNTGVAPTYATNANGHRTRTYRR